MKRDPFGYFTLPTRGFAILITFLMFSLFYMLSVVFLINAFIQRILVRNYVNMVKARFVAEAGVHTAIGNILGDFGFFAPAQNKPVDYRWRYEQDLPPEYATRPSYAVLNEDGTPKLVTISIEDKLKRYGYSGYIQSGSYGINSDIYHLKVTEASAQLYVNEGLYASGLHPYNTAVIQRVLNTLGELRGVGSNLGDIIIEGRGQGYKNRQELRRMLVSRLGEEDYNKIKDFLCVHTYSDTGVVNPVPLSAHERVRDDYEETLFLTRPLYGGQPFTRYGRGRMNYPDPEDPNKDLGKINQGFGSEAYPPNTTPMVFYGDHTGLGQTFVYAWQELNPCWIEVTQRAPVNINTAPREILVALLEGLQGFFVLEQLRTSQSKYSIIYEAGDCFRFEYPVPEPSGYAEPDSCPQNLPGEIGIIFKTQPIDRTTARQIADRIISARPIYTWQDFNDLIDRMVWLPDRQGVVIRDSRSENYFNFFKPRYSDYTLLEWEMYRYYASQAIADIIKANFNPNLHLNELNPNAPLYTMVDKTDLITNSTEFCFLPTGYFQIESVGRVLRPAQEDGTFTLSVTKVILRDSLDPKIPNQLLGQRRISVEVKLWDLCRQGVQRDFARGSYSKNTSPYHTDLNRGLQSGPEPNNGPAPFQNSYEGYLQLTTYGSCLAHGQTWLKGKLYRTPPTGWEEEPFAVDGVNMGMHAHFDFDFGLHSAKSYDRPLSDLTGTVPSDVGNFAWGVPNATEGYDIFTLRIRPPYSSASRGGRYRLCRAYKYGQIIHIDPFHLAPHDQRIDGFYAERFSMLPYYSRGGNFNAEEGTVTYWIKPGFFPELHGYHRVFCSLARGKTGDPSVLHVPGHFDHKWGWSTDKTEYSEFDLPSMQIPLVPYAMLFNIDKKSPLETMDVWSSVQFTPTLNHRYHTYGWPGEHIEGREGEPFGHHRWTHVMLAWRNKNGQTANSRIFVNGRWYQRPFAYYSELLTSPPDYTSELVGGGLNPFMLGGTRWSKRTANSTLDEFHLAVAVDLVEGEVMVLCPDCMSGVINCYPYCQNACLRFLGYPGVIAVDEGEDICPNCSGSGQCSLCAGDGVLEDTLKCSPCWIGIQSCDCPSEDDCDPFNDCEDMACSVCLTPGSGNTKTDNLVPGDGKDRFCQGDGLVKLCDICGCNGSTLLKCERCEGTGAIIEIQEYPVPHPSLQNQWRTGRYYRQNDAEFISYAIDLAGKPDRTTPDQNPMTDPYGGPRWSGKEIPGQEQIEDWFGRGRDPVIKLLGVSWTAYTREVMDASMEGGNWLNAQVELSLERKDGQGQWLHFAGPFLGHDAAWAPVMAQLPRNYPQVRYRLRFNTHSDPLNTILLETPILDDVTIYYATLPVYLSWVESH